MRTLLTAFSLLLFSAVYSLTLNDSLSEDYSIQFSAKKAEGSIYGLAGTVRFNPNDLANALIDVAADAATISTGNDTKDKHARGNAWLDTETYPEISFRSNDFTARDGRYVVRGELTLRGVRRSIEIPFEQTTTEPRGGRYLTGSFTLDRNEYGIEGPFLFGGLVGDEVTVNLRAMVTE